MPALKELLERKKVLVNGKLNLAHPFGFQAGAYAVGEEDNKERKCVELAILTPYGLYRHRQVFSPEGIEKIQSLWTNTSRILVQLKRLEEIVDEYQHTNDEEIEKFLLKSFPGGLLQSIGTMKTQLKTLRLQQGSLSAATFDKRLLEACIRSPVFSMKLKKEVELSIEPAFRSPVGLQPRMGIVGRIESVDQLTEVETSRLFFHLKTHLLRQPCTGSFCRVLGNLMLFNYLFQVSIRERK